MERQRLLGPREQRGKEQQEGSLVILSSREEQRWRDPLSQAGVLPHRVAEPLVTSR